MRVAAPPEARLVYTTIALSGMTALGAEVVWTRMLSLLFGATTVHVFVDPCGLSRRPGYREHGGL
jgi:hypothetical protein